MPVTTNLAEVVGRLEGLAHALDLDGPGDGAATFGDQLLDLYAEDVRDRSLGTATAPDGTAWAGLNEAYAARKARTHGVRQIGVLTGAMLSLEQLRGERTIGPHVAATEYGRDERNRRVALWFQGGTTGPGRRRQPPRPFWGTDDRGTDLLAAAVAARLDAALRGA